MFGEQGRGASVGLGRGTCEGSITRESAMGRAPGSPRTGSRIESTCRIGLVTKQVTNRAPPGPVPPNAQELVGIMRMALGADGDANVGGVHSDAWTGGTWTIIWP
jgi:hypothetical protein